MERKMKKISMFMTIVFVFLYSKNSYADKYSPLKTGSTWTFEYNFAGEAKYNHKNYTHTIKILGNTELNNKKVSAFEYPNNNLVFCGEDSEGFFCYAKQTPEDVSPVIYESPSYVYKFPIKIGDQLKSKTNTFLLQKKIDVEVTSTIKSINETAITPAGTFTDCLKIVTEGSKSVDNGTYAIEIHTWKAPSVGTVKSILINSYDDGKSSKITSKMITILKNYSVN